MLVYNAVKCIDCNAVGFTELFNKLLQMVTGNTAHIYSLCAKHGSCGELEVEQSRSGFCIFAVHFKEISDLE